MLGWLKGRTLRRRTGQQLYERIVAQARNPALYARCGVPDTMDGRLEMLLLHTVLVLDRLRAEGVAGQRPGQQLMERLVADVDDALRQIGLGDDSVSPRIKRLGSALAERARDYRSTLDATTAGDHANAGYPSPLEAKLIEHAYRTDPAAVAPDMLAEVRRLAGYIAATRAVLAGIPSREVLMGELMFPPVAPDCTARPEEGHA